MTTKELIKKFADHCNECVACFRCRFYNTSSGIGACLDAYLEQIYSGEMAPEDSFEEKGK